MDCLAGNIDRYARIFVCFHKVVGRPVTGWIPDMTIFKGSKNVAGNPC